MADAQHDHELRAAQDRLLERFVPEASVRSVRWSLGQTQVIELGDGPPLLLLHGGGDGAFEWVPILRSLSATHRAIAVDRPGHGLADPFSYRGVDLSAHISSFLAEVIDALALPATDVLANSIGGYWAAVSALAEPHRYRRIVIAGAPPGVVRDAPLPMRMMGLPLVGPPIGRLVMGKPSRENSRTFWSRMLVAHPERLADEMMDVDAAHMRRNADDVRELLYLLIGPRGIRRDLVLGERWARLTVPLLALFGERDAFVTKRMARAWEDLASGDAPIQVRRIPGAGHIPWIDEPEGTVRAVAGFLTEEDA
jgi:pimeloyl-ACP methyl ester carboxylesterase